MWTANGMSYYFDFCRLCLIIGYVEAPWSPVAGRRSIELTSENRFELRTLPAGTIAFTRETVSRHMNHSHYRLRLNFDKTVKATLMSSSEWLAKTVERILGEFIGTAG